MATANKIKTSESLNTGISQLIVIIIPEANSRDQQTENCDCRRNTQPRYPKNLLK